MHSKSLKALDICEHGAIGVNSAGVIEFVERNFKKLQDVFTKHGGYKDAAVVEAKEGQFFFPGFIGMSCLDCVFAGAHNCKPTESTTQDEIFGTNVV